MILTVGEQIHQLISTYKMRFGKPPGLIRICEVYHQALLNEVRFSTRTSATKVAEYAGVKVEMEPGPWIGMEAVEK
jgi:hypothetical protein